MLDNLFNSKIRLYIILAIILAAALTLFLYWYGWPLKKQEAEPQNLAETQAPEIPQTNPFEEAKTNPFKDIKTNPFE